MKKLILIIFLITGCDQLNIKDDDANKDSAGNLGRIDSSALEDNIKVNIQGGDPEKYVVQFSWPRIEDKKILRIRLGRVLAEVQPSQTYFTHTVGHNQVLTYSFDVLDSKRVLERTISKSMVIPYDLVIRKDNAFINNGTKIEANRLYLNDDATLFIQDNSVELSINEVYSKGGLIQSFPKDGNDEITAPIGKNGKSGGSLVLTANKLFGPLKVDLRGENGGQGLDGAPYDGRAAKGTPAGKGRGHGNPGGPGGPGEDPFYCDYGADAGNGAPGANGRPGGIGGNGGNSGNVKISIKQFLPLEGIGSPPTEENTGPITVQLTPGVGAKGGNPGPPQQGGLGGDGNSGADWDCSGERGNPGPDGKSGIAGDAGKDGSIGLKCIYVGSENINECTQ